jgi:poly-beta-1,6-N-acetyl-D-glucosamine synthase
MARSTSTAVLIACKNGEATIGNTVRSVVDQADVFVVSDGSTDRTADAARAAGARVITRAKGGGKPAALRLGYRLYRIEQRYRYVAVLDDDTIVEPDYVAKIEQKMNANPRIAAASGRIDSLWDHTRRWNPYIAMRAFMYWSYQVTTKRGQNALHVVNVICGANTLFRIDVFGQLIDDDVPYAIDDMYWLAEIVRCDLGRVEYVHAARSWTIDPHTFRDWYRQTVRWSWAQFQSVRGHHLGSPLQRDRTRRVGFRFSWFDLAYLGLLLDWLPYMLEPLLIVPVVFLLSPWIDWQWFAIFYFATSFIWFGVAAAALHKPRLLVLAPALLVLDLVYRVTMLHACVKTIVRPTIDVCTWESPTRFEPEADGSAAAVRPSSATTLQST